jgi:hypothetical protein
MFDVYCPGHHSRVILCPENIRAVVKDDHRVDVRWRCLCGETGVRRFDRHATKMLEIRSR